ncbi:hypothetical protein EV127DRAFT_427391 [Xylaria flabelliformis]|nr:hypothetical protein EV127DRAFT_427391 [Xylaria flabelliformis]
MQWKWTDTALLTHEPATVIARSLPDHLLAQMAQFVWENHPDKAYLQALCLVEGAPQERLIWAVHKRRVQKLMSFVTFRVEEWLGCAIIIEWEHRRQCQKDAEAEQRKRIWEVVFRQSFTAHNPNLPSPLIITCTPTPQEKLAKLMTKVNFWMSLDLSNLRVRQVERARQLVSDACEQNKSCPLDWGLSGERNFRIAHTRRGRVVFFQR